MRIFWTIFFLGSMVVAGLDVRERRQSTTQLVPGTVTAYGDALGVPTPRP